MKVTYEFTSFGDLTFVAGEMEVDPSEIRAMTDKQLCEMKVAATLFDEGCCPDLDMDREIKGEQ